jgi:hypothetical protein
MRSSTQVCVVGIVLLLAACASAPPAPAAKTDPAVAEKEVTQRVNLLLTRYASNDQVGVIAMLDPGKFTLLGTNLGEGAHSASELREFMDRDFGQWKTVAITNLRDMDMRVDGSMATAFFTVSFAAGGGPAVPVKLFTTWHKINGEWMVTQSASALPPQG